MAHRNNPSSTHADLEEFIHVMFTELRSDEETTLGQSYTHVYTKRVYDYATAWSTGFGPALMHVVAMKSPTALLISEQLRSMRRNI